MQYIYCMHYLYKMYLFVMQCHVMSCHIHLLLDCGYELFMTFMQYLCSSYAVLMLYLYNGHAVLNGRVFSCGLSHQKLQVFFFWCCGLLSFSL